MIREDEDQITWIHIRLHEDLIANDVTTWVKDPYGTVLLNGVCPYDSSKPVADGGHLAMLSMVAISTIFEDVARRVKPINSSAE